MRRFALTLLVAAAPLLAAGGAQAQPGAAGQAGTADASRPDVTVRGPERMVCRAVTRTSTRMRTSRVCRTQSEWEEARAGRSQDEELAEAADTLEQIGEKVSTGCIGGMGGGHNTALGPR